jgi:hypothetical protein
MYECMSKLTLGRKESQRITSDHPQPSILLSRTIFLAQPLDQQKPAQSSGLTLIGPDCVDLGHSV